MGMGENSPLIATPDLSLAEVTTASRREQKQEKRRPQLGGKNKKLAKDELCMKGAPGILGRRLMSASNWLPSY